MSKLTELMLHVRTRREVPQPVLSSLRNKLTLEEIQASVDSFLSDGDHHYDAAFGLIIVLSVHSSWRTQENADYLLVLIRATEDLQQRIQLFDQIDHDVAILHPDSLPAYKELRQTSLRVENPKENPAAAFRASLRRGGLHFFREIPTYQSPDSPRSPATYLNSRSSADSSPGNISSMPTHLCPPSSETLSEEEIFLSFPEEESLTELFEHCQGLLKNEFDPQNIADELVMRLDDFEKMSMKGLKRLRDTLLKPSQGENVSRTASGAHPKTGDTPARYSIHQLVLMVVLEKSNWHFVHRKFNPEDKALKSIALVCVEAAMQDHCKKETPRLSR